jgi:hypothetical protein
MRSGRDAAPVPPVTLYEPLEYDYVKLYEPGPPRLRVM